MSNFSVSYIDVYIGLSYVCRPGLARWVETCVNAVNPMVAHTHPLIFRQFYESESSTYTYLLADMITREAILIDPVVETAER